MLMISWYGDEDGGYQVWRPDFMWTTRWTTNGCRQPKALKSFFTRKVRIPFFHQSHVFSLDLLFLQSDYMEFEAPHLLKKGCRSALLETAQALITSHRFSCRMTSWTTDPGVRDTVAGSMLDKQEWQSLTTSERTRAWLALAQVVTKLCGLGRTQRLRLRRCQRGGTDRWSALSWTFVAVNVGPSKAWVALLEVRLLL